MSCDAAAALLPQAGMHGDGAVDLPAPPEEASERELDFGGVAVRFRHAREHLRRMVEAIIDQVIEADVVIARQPHGTRPRRRRPRDQRRCRPR